MKSKNLLFIVIIILLVGCLTFSSFAHSGGTDGNGGHYSDGGYHYHHGYPAHQHTNEICPYDYEDNTHYNNSSNGISEKTLALIILIVIGAVVILLSIITKRSIIEIMTYILLIPCAIILIIPAIAYIIDKIKNRKQRKKSEKPKCKTCKFYNVNRINELGQARCTKHPFWVNDNEVCENFESKYK